MKKKEYERIEKVCVCVYEPALFRAPPVAAVLIVASKSALKARCTRFVIAAEAPRRASNSPSRAMTWTTVITAYSARARGFYGKKKKKRFSKKLD